MKLKEFYREIGSSYADVTARLGNEEFVRHFVLLFKDDKSFEELKESLKKGLATDAFRAAHTLKGVAANLGFSALYENAAEITEALRGGDLNAAAAFPRTRGKIQQGYRSCRRALKYLTYGLLKSKIMSTE